jgi:PKD repeat protein
MLLIMKRVNRILLIALSLLVAASCIKKPEVTVYADFTTDKEVYEIYEDITITNTSTCANDIITACKWEWGSEHVWGKQLEKPLSFDTPGDKEITLTAVADCGIAGTCTKIIKVQDTNVRPVADFSYSPASGIQAGDEVQFTDKSSDPDGKITAWEWKFGANTVTEQNPRFTFNEAGDIEVTLTVTDNKRGKGSVTKIVHVDKNQNSMEVLWSTSYDGDGDVIFSSPAVSPDGKTIYAFSTGLHLAAIGSDGKQKWSFDAGSHNPGTTKNFGACTPSVDADGTIYVIVGNKDTQDKTGTYQSGIYAVKPDGKQKWYYAYGYGWFCNVIPLVLNDVLFVGTKRNPAPADFPELWPSGSADNGLLLYKGDGSYAGFLQVKRGTHGGVAATKEENFMVHTDTKYGTRVYWKEGDGWKYYGAAAGQNAFMLGYIGNKNTEIGFTSYMCIDQNNKTYILMGHADGAGSSEAAATLLCYDLNKYDKEAGATPEWTLDLDGNNKMYYSLGTVLGEDGTVYVTTTAGVTAVNPNGSKKWFAPASGNEVFGSPAVDKKGFVYYTETAADLSAGKLVKLNSSGVKVAEVTLGQSVCTSPTIAPDGTIYCNGVKDGRPTLTAIKGVAEPASGWSQLGGNPRKTCKAE